MSTLTNALESSYYYNIVDAITYYQDINIKLPNRWDDNIAKNLLFDIYEIDYTIFDDNRRFTKLFYVLFENEFGNESLYFMRILFDLGLNINNYIYNSNNRKYNITIFNYLIRQILDSYTNEYILASDSFIVKTFKLIFEYSKIDYDRGDTNYYDLLYSDEYSDMDKQRLIQLLEKAKTNTNTYMAKQRLALAKVDSIFGEYLDLDTLNTLGESLKTQSFDPNISFYKHNLYETYDDHFKHKSILERKKYMQKRSNRKFAKRTQKKRKPKRF